MRSLLRRNMLRSCVPAPAVLRGVAVSGMVIALAAAHNPARPGLVPWPAGHRPAASAHATASTDAAAFRQIILPDLLVVDPAGLSAAKVARIRKTAGVRNVIAFDGGQISAGGRPVSVIGVSPGQFRAWTPLRTASDQAFWAALSKGSFVASQAASARLGLRRRASYQLAGASTRAVPFAMAASLGIGGVDLLVNSRTSAQLGLVHRVAALISAPGAGLAGLTGAIRAMLGAGAKIVSLRSPQLPVAAKASGQLPGSYLSLFRESAARYCPGMSWTVLAAIGQIESADGTNVGPSTAGALGPMQFMPSTWREWGIAGFGRSGPPDIMNPYDAVPSAARMLCADGAAGGSHGLYQAIFAYNHAGWYVSEVLGLAAEYAKDYP